MYFSETNLTSLQRVSLLRQKRDCGVITLKIVVHVDLGRPIKVAIMWVCVCVCRFQLLCLCVCLGGVRPPLRRLDVRRPGGWTSAAPAAGRSPPRRLDARRPGGWTSTASAVWRLPPLRMKGSRPLSFCKTASVWLQLYVNVCFPCDYFEIRHFRSDLIEGNKAKLIFGLNNTVAVYFTEISTFN